MKLTLDYVEPEDWRTEEEKEKLQSGRWKARRLEIMKKYDYTCQYCGFRCLKWQIAHHINHKKGDDNGSNLSVMCQMCNVVHHSGLGCSIMKVVDLYKKSKYSQEDIVRITRKMRKEDKKDQEIIKFLGLKGKAKFKKDRKYLKGLFGFVTNRFKDKQNEFSEGFKS